MACIYAYSNSAFVFNLSDYLCYMFKCKANIAALSGSIFNYGNYTFCFVKGNIYGRVNFPAVFFQKNTPFAFSLVSFEAIKGILVV